MNKEHIMAILQVRDVDDRLYNTLKQKAQIENRSISQEVISILEKYLSNPNYYNNVNLTREFLNLSWEDNRDANEIVKDIVKDRRNKKSFGEFHGIFD
jgi:plasmid stability protein